MINNSRISKNFVKKKLNGVVLGIDPTYNICNYYVAICTYKNALLEVSGTDRSPVIIGLAITQAQETFESYLKLLHNMSRHNRNTAQLKMFGTDTEVNIFQAFKTWFLMQIISNAAFIQKTTSRGK